MRFPPEYRDEREFFETVKRLRHIGFGRMMQMISDHWRDLDPVGALSVGPCYSEKGIKQESCSCSSFELVDSCKCSKA